MPFSFFTKSSEPKKHRKGLPWLSSVLPASRPAAYGKTRLTNLMQVFAAFSKASGKIIEADIDSSLALLRYDYPEELYTDLRESYKEALIAPQKLDEVAAQLANELATDEKILLGVQLYLLISRSGTQLEELVAFYHFMTGLGVASQAVDIVYQLDPSQRRAGHHSPEDSSHDQVLETLQIDRSEQADISPRNLDPSYGALIFRFENLLLIKNTGTTPITARGRSLRAGEFARIFAGQRLILGDLVLTYEDLLFYLNAKKGVSSTLLYLSFGAGGSALFDRRPTKQSELEIRFGLGVSVTALTKTNAIVGGEPLKVGETVEADLGDYILKGNQEPIALARLRRLARDLGAHFELPSGRSKYRISTNPDNLKPGDLLLSGGLSGEILLEVLCDYERRRGQLKVLASDRAITLRGQTVRDEADLVDGDRISLGGGQFLRCDFTERIIEEQRTIIKTLEVEELTQRFGKETALSGVSFEASRGQLLCVMGPSGSGKSTLLRILAGQLRPSSGTVHLNGQSLYPTPTALRPSISFMPQEESFDPLLTVEENLLVAAAQRCPHLPATERSKRVESRLIELGLHQLGNRLAGDETNKFLSGGQRKRLNIGLDMTSTADVFLFDEPTSGLSSKDSEQILEIIRGLAQNKIVVVSIHQPSNRLFSIFDRALLLDRGGRVAYFGSPNGMLQYFSKAWSEQDSEEAINVTGPEDIFDILETPLREPGGDVIYEPDHRGLPHPARRFPPEFWRDRHQAHRVLEDVRPGSLTPAPKNEKQDSPTEIPELIPGSIKHEGVRFLALFARSFLSRLRNRSNLFTTLLQAPALAILIALVLRYSEDGSYNFASAFHVPTYLFLSLVVAMFLGLTAGADDIIRDLPMLFRERNHRLKATHYVLAKFFTLGSFALLQVLIYLLIGNAILEIRESFSIQFRWMFPTALVGVCLGLLVSSWVRDAKTALSIIPLILIPQIILGGALIRYEEMNRNLDFLYSIRKWVAGEDSTTVTPPSRLRVPIFCEFMPLRWAYEGSILAQANQNPLSQVQADLNATMKSLVETSSERELSLDEVEQLDTAKNALMIASSLSGTTAGDVGNRLHQLQKEISSGTLDPSATTWTERPPTESTLLHAEDLYINHKIRDLTSKAEFETTDYRFSDAPPNVFLGTSRHLFGYKIPTLTLNFWVLITTILGLLFLLQISIRRKLAKLT